MTDMADTHPHTPNPRPSVSAPSNQPTGRFKEKGNFDGEEASCALSQSTSMSFDQDKLKTSKFLGDFSDTTVGKSVTGTPPRNAKQTQVLNTGKAVPALTASPVRQKVSRYGPLKSESMNVVSGVDKKKRAGPAGQRADNSSSVSGDVTVRSATAGKDVQTKEQLKLEESPLATKFTFYIGEGKAACCIQDFENNSFTLDMKEFPVTPVIDLAGEVPGLAPTAVSEDPIEPRVFVINRRADVLEAVSAQEISDMDRRAALSPDTVKVSSLAETALISDLGVTGQHTYFTHRRTVNASDCFKFAMVFPPRGWHDVPLPSSTAIALRKSPLKMFFNPSEGVSSLKVFIFVGY